MTSPRRLWRRLVEWARSPRRLLAVDGDGPPAVLPPRDVVLLLDGGEPWSAVMRCPCGCQQAIELPLIPEARPRWRLDRDDQDRPTLFPSVWLKDGCKSHFFLRAGKVKWVD